MWTAINWNCALLWIDLVGFEQATCSSWGLHYRNVTTVLRQVYDSQALTILRSSPNGAVTAALRPLEKTVFRNESSVPAIFKGDETVPNRERVTDQNESIAFNDAVLPHLDAAYNLARWLTRNDHDAEDVVQEASLRAFKYWAGISHQDSRSWLLAIVRNTFYTWLRQRSPDAHPFSDADLAEVGDKNPNPERAALQGADREMLKAALEDLPLEFREAIVLREMEGLSYKEIADISNVPVGTVMSRLARGRKRLQANLTELGLRR
jgi:RNA polymerase sigma-70 factor (ECF subfamily)